MFGSDWPVCRLAGAEHHQVSTILTTCLLLIHLQVVDLLHGILDLCGVEGQDKEKIFKQNALKFYKINI